jgi:predicted ABC-type ATPase
LRSREQALRTDQPKTPGAIAELDDPKPGSDDPKSSPAADLRHRSYRLPPGHPSSPIEADGRRKPPGPRLQDIALPEPVTDTEHAEHVKDIRDRLDKARAHGLSTDQQHTTDPAREVWSEQRDALQDSIIEYLYARASDVPCERRAIIAGGLSGAGKSTVLEKHAGIDLSQYLTVNPDKIKEEMADRGMVPMVEGLSPMEASDLVHEESSYIARQLAMLAQADGKNIIWDITMSSRGKTERRIDELRAVGYTAIQGIFVEIPVDMAVTRSDGRHRAGQDDYRAGRGMGGRFVPEEVIRAQADSAWGSLPRKNFEAVKHRFDTWARYDNSAAAPILADAGHQEEGAHDQRSHRPDRRPAGRLHEPG